MKKNTIFLAFVIIIAIAVLGVWYFNRPLPYCEVVYKENPNTKKLEVTCDETHCNKTCYKKFRKKGSEDEWREVPAGWDNYSPFAIASSKGFNPGSSA